MELTELANIAQIISVPLTILAWLITGERFAEFWKKWGKLILAVTVVLAIAALWRIGWLNWLQYQVTWPIWGLLIALSALVAILYIVSQYSQKRRKKARIRRFEELISRGRRLRERFSRAKDDLCGEDRIDYDQYELSCTSLLLRTFGKDSIYAEAFYDVTHVATGVWSGNESDWGELFSTTFDGWLAVLKSALEELQNS